MARRFKNAECKDLLEQAQAGKLAMQIHVDYDWETSQEFSYDSEDELDEKISPLQRSFGSSPSPTTGQPILFSPNRWGCSGMDISNKTYETIVIPSQPGQRNSATEKTPPPLPLKKPPKGSSKSKPDASESLPHSPDSPDVWNSSLSSIPSVLEGGPFWQSANIRNSMEVKATAYWETCSDVGGASQRRRSEPTQMIALQPSPGTSPEPGQTPPVRFSSESTRSYRRISSSSSMGKYSSSPLSPQSPCCPDEVSLCKTAMPGPTPLPVPTPRRFAPAKGRLNRVKALADCKGDKARELTFSKGEVIVVTREEDEQNWISNFQEPLWEKRELKFQHAEKSKENDLHGEKLLARQKGMK
ncbi:PREDICTED: arf-GAP with SH3 domain, ANK repeat and PH domain-containing protein 3-like [Thamnophis sirtalis]|uniref:Arf-GAP with SH3 domain, ANK repeat and PH domain-containing protein 3-like n=1 Tax=Thamnophis sirtalis TaxID=35019 RepID=A0A6I9XYP5_9SAUR|nr:PREDICTED: arf-GAP with SH3 domain, ANK repeat and PH domain-containing protein 3-like [Thamnophis sirtalis]